MKSEKNKVNLFLDSGAFSAWTQGVSIDIQEYIAFIKEHESVLTVYANLDGIPKVGRADEKTDNGRISAELTLKNQKIIEAAGLSPLPVFHYGEPWKYLDYYIERYDYTALGVAGNSGISLFPWLDECFSKHICDENGMPRIKVHGFAVTSLPVMLRYPWYSVDSTSWVVTGRMGSIYIPRYRDGRWVYDENSWKVSVSNKSPNMKEAGQHITTLSKGERIVLEKYISEKGYCLGVSEHKEEPQDYILQENEKWAEKKPKDKKVKRSVEIIIEPGISNKYQLRDEMNIIYFQDLEKSMPEWPWAFEKKGGQNGFF